LDHDLTWTQVKMGRDHTIYAVAPGFVSFYREKHLRGQRKFVGVVLERGEKLPRDELSLGRSRYCGLVDVNRVVSPTSTITAS
jgi:large subunit ribosomal protein L27